MRHSWHSRLSACLSLLPVTRCHISFPVYDHDFIGLPVDLSMTRPLEAKATAASEENSKACSLSAGTWRLTLLKQLGRKFR